MAHLSVQEPEPEPEPEPVASYAGGGQGLTAVVLYSYEVSRAYL